MTRYAHLSSFNTSIQNGSTITAGQVIGYSGNTGVGTGPHLHFEYCINGDDVNPELYVDFSEFDVNLI